MRWLEQAFGEVACRHLAAAIGAQRVTGNSGQVLDPQFVFRATKTWKDQLTYVVQSCTHNDVRFLDVLTAAAQPVLCHMESAVAFFVHERITKNDLSDDALDFCSFTIPLLAEKDVCLAKMWMCMERRLLVNATDIQREESALQAIKVACGRETFIGLRSMSIMINDINQSDTLSASLSHNLKTSNFAFRILTSNCWATVGSGAAQPLLPQDMQLQVNAAEKLYTQKNPHRTLTWCHASSFGTVRLLYTKNVHEIVLPLAGLLGLASFDEMRSDSLLLSQIAACMGSTVGLNEAFEQLNKKGILKREGECISINRAFSSKLRKISLLSKLAIQTTGGDEALDKQHEFVLQACIVRLLKKHRTVGHEALFAETVEQLKGRFLPTTANFKKAIEILMTKEYVERSPENRMQYVFLA